MRVNKNYVVIKEDQQKTEEKTESGIILTNMYDDDRGPCVGTVVEVGEGEYSKLLIDLKKGDRVVYPRGVSTAFYTDKTKNGSKLSIVESKHILLVLEDGDMK